MMNNGFISPRVPCLMGRVEQAEYKPQQLSKFTGNPLIEALPPILKPKESISLIAYSPKYKEYERKLEGYLRLHCVQGLQDLVIPTSDHVDLEQRISRMIRYGYQFRNPVQAEFTRRLENSNLITDKDINEHNVSNNSSTGFVNIGLSGLGKSTGIERNLLLYPQVIIHQEYKKTQLNFYQIVWLKLDCPPDASTKSLCINFFLAVDSLLGSNYFDKYKNSTTNVLIPLMARIASLHSLGVLVIDEIQNLREAASGGAERMLNFFVNLVNTIGVPLILVGTPRATSVIASTFKNARRGSGQGDKIWDPLRFDREWDLIMKKMWKYQWTVNNTELTEELSKVMYEESQGIIDITKKLYMLAQWRAITTSTEKISTSIIRSVAKDSLRLLKPALDALKSRNQTILKGYDDITISNDVLANAFIDAQSQFAVKEKIVEYKEFVDEGDKNEPFKKNIDIATWLIEAGVEEDLAQKTAEKVVKDFPDEDVAALRQKAFMRCNIKSSDTGNPEKRKTKTKKNHDPDSLITIYADSRKAKVSNYEMLLKKGYIKDIDELQVL